MVKSYVYCIRNTLDGKCYVGKSNDPERRFKGHCKPNSSLISRAIHKYGKEVFEFQVVEECDTEDDAFKREVWYIAFFDCISPSGYNLDGGGEGGKKRHPESITRGAVKLRGRHLSDETKNKLSASLKKVMGFYNNRPEYKAKMSRSIKRVSADPDHSRKMSRIQKIAQNRSEVKEKMSASVRRACARPGARAQRAAGANKKWAQEGSKERHASSLRRAWDKKHMKSQLDHMSRCLDPMKW